MGLAALISRKRGLAPLSEQWRLVQQEVETCPWFPASVRNVFHDLDAQRYWQNIEDWRGHEQKRASLPLQSADTDGLPGLSKDVVESILMCCQPALLAQLVECEDYAEIDLTESGRPWPRIFASFGKKDRCDDIVGAGIVRFSVAVHPERICPYQRCPQVHFVAVRADGSKCRFNGLDKTDADRARECDQHDKCLAFRLAAGWEVRGRWEAFKYRVFVDLIDDFRKSCRSQDGGRKLFAWTLSAELQDSFRSWLRHDRQPCSVVEQLRRITREDPELPQTVDKAVAVVAEQFSQPVSHRPGQVPQAKYTRPSTPCTPGQVPQAKYPRQSTPGTPGQVLQAKYPRPSIPG